MWRFIAPDTADRNGSPPANELEDQPALWLLDRVDETLGPEHRLGQVGQDLLQHAQLHRCIRCKGPSVEGECVILIVEMTVRVAGG